MLDSLIQLLKAVDEFFWGYVAFVLIMVLGLLLSFRARFFQVFRFPQIIRTFFQCMGDSGGEAKRGVHPVKAFLASTGGMIGIGNVVGIVTAVQLGGPGALVWVWVAGVIGAVVKYCEIYLGFKYRVENAQGGYNGGPMYFLKKAFSWKVLPALVAFLLCIYGVEIYQFSVITDSIASNWQTPRLLIIGVLLAAVLYAGLGGVRRIGQICSWVMPLFLLTYILMGVWVVVHEAPALPGMAVDVFRSAFTGHAAVGGFAGSSVILAIQNGIARAAYSSDIGIGYDSIIQSESRVTHPERQARLAILGVAIDNLICTLSILVVLASGVWKATTPLEGSQLIQAALSQYFPYMNVFLPFFFIVTGYTTIIAFFVVGLKCAQYLMPRGGKSVYLVYAITSFLFFSFIPQGHALLVMSICGFMLLTINLLGIYRLRHEISFEEEEIPALSMAEETM
ncbi:MAG: Amino-acid carrier protein AlsT [Chlamydiae bacterium]|nr:Amino-acid carrier protein AlsT [Chlamydiota bacterium]